MQRLMSAAEWAEFKAWLDGISERSSSNAPPAQEEAPMRPVYVPSAMTFAPEENAPAKALTPAERRVVGIAADHRPEHHEGQHHGRIERLMVERRSTCG